MKTDPKRSKWCLEGHAGGISEAHDGMVKNIHTKFERNRDRERDLIRDNKHCMQNECDFGTRRIRTRTAIVSKRCACIDESLFSWQTIKSLSQTILSNLLEVCRISDSGSR